MGLSFRAEGGTCSFFASEENADSSSLRSRNDKFKNERNGIRKSTDERRQVFVARAKAPRQEKFSYGGGNE
jgi:hypothetical protein